MIQIVLTSHSNNLLSGQFDEMLTLVSDSRKERAKRFLRHEDACRSVIGELLARYCISRFAHVPTSEIVFKIDEFGKPYLDGEEKIHFNVSHSHEFIACAISDTPVGIDIEKVRICDNDIAKRFFHEKEYDYLEKTLTEKKAEIFFELWTLKESYVKALGKGLSLSLKSFCVLPDTCHLGMEVFREIPKMHFKLYEVASNYKCALCCEPHIDFPHKITMLTPVQLLEALRQESQLQL